MKPCELLLETRGAYAKGRVFEEYLLPEEQGYGSQVAHCFLLGPQ